MNESSRAKVCALLAAVLVVSVLPPAAAAESPRPRLLAEQYPRVDGSTSTQPLGALVACRLTRTSFAWSQHLFDGTRRLIPTADPYDPGKTLVLGHQRAPNLVPPISPAGLGARTQHTGTHESYTSLIARTADIVLAAREPSEDELALARERGVQIKTAAIALDAFVFIVNKSNPVRSVSPDQIRRIYTGRLTDWAELGGPKGEIHPYQRNRNSGSQEAMEKIVMKGLVMMKAKDLEIPLTMVGPFNAVRGDTAGIGYTFYYYDTHMTFMPEIAMLGINGVRPVPRTIADRSYPFVAEVYVAWLGSLPEDSPAAGIRDWLLTQDGQSVVAESGYVPIRR
jgi:phosphate transport system substrate-binding protein